MKMNENGRSMVEMLGVLAIIGVLSAGGLAGYSKAMFKHKLNSTMEQITMLVTNIRTMYGAQGNYAGLATDAVNLGIVPAVMGNTMTALTNPFKGAVTIAEASATTNTALATNAEDALKTAFVLTYSGLPVEACIALASADFGAGAGSGFIGVKAVNGTTAANAVVAKVGTDTAKAGNETKNRSEGSAYEVDEAILACSGTSQESSVSWKFY